jgi:hypothetical protein
VITVRRISWAGRAAYMGGMRYTYKILVGNFNEGDHLGNLGIDESAVLK